MKNTIKNKKGISLIVLVITIIVMIILAAAIILSISNSGIMDKANKAKLDSDTANLKEYVNVLEAEWELMTESEKSSSGYASKVAYVNGELTKKGYSAAYSAEGEIFTVANEVAKDALSKGIKIGDEVKYTVTAKTEESKLADNGNSNQNISNKTDFVWRYIGVSEKGELMIAADITSAAPTITLEGATGWLKGPDELDRLCGVLYSTDKGKSRSMNIDDVTRILGYTGEKGAYQGTSGEYIPTLKTIKEIGDEIGYNMNVFCSLTPDNTKTIGEYKSDYYKISKTIDVRKMKKSKYVDLVYPASGTYFLASSCVFASFGNTFAYFYLRCVDSTIMRGIDLFNSGFGDLERDSYAFRPVVSLTSTIQKNTEKGSTVWSFE